MNTTNYELNQKDVEYIGYLIGLEEERLYGEMSNLKQKEYRTVEESENFLAVTRSLTEEIPNLKRKLGLTF